MVEYSSQAQPAPVVGSFAAGVALAVVVEALPAVLGLHSAAHTQLSAAEDNPALAADSQGEFLAELLPSAAVLGVGVHARPSQAETHKCPAAS